MLPRIPFQFRVLPLCSAPIEVPVAAAAVAAAAVVVARRKVIHNEMHKCQHLTVKMVVQTDSQTVS